MIIKYIYSVFLGLLIVLFVGVGISVFYPQPVQPQYPPELNYAKTELTAQQAQLQKENDSKMQAWEQDMKIYNRNVSIMTLVAAVVLVAISLAMGERAKVIADGIMYGGVFTLLYSIGRGLASNNTKYSFLVVTVGLFTAILLGYMKFIKPHHSNAAISN